MTVMTTGLHLVMLMMTVVVKILASAPVVPDDDRSADNPGALTSSR
jgi:hypothetical protein